MEQFEIKGLSFSYLKRDNQILSDIELTINYGEFIVLCGKSGSGKTTLLRHLKSSLTPRGRSVGVIIYNKRALSELSQKEQSGKIAFVLQNPENQIVTDRVWAELAFGLENLGASQDEIRLRVAEVSMFFGIDSWFDMEISQLSGGQKQLLNLAAVMTLRPEIIVLDEPLSQLDPIAATEFLNALNKINKELGVTILITEHRLEEVVSLADRVLVIENGRIIADCPPEKIGTRLREQESYMYFALPTVIRVFDAVDGGEKSPTNIVDGKKWIDSIPTDKEISFHNESTSFLPKTKENKAVELKEVCFRYEKQAEDVLSNLTLNAYRGEIFALLGANGAGKSTVLSLIAKQNKPYRGGVRVNGRVGLLPQNPASLFLEDTLEADLKLISEDIAEVVRFFALEGLLKQNPLDLSGGEIQRAALAKLYLTKPDVLLLDEPTKGFDRFYKERLFELLDRLRREGKAIIIVSHDIEFCAEYCDYCAMLFNGQLVMGGRPVEVFSKTNYYTTMAGKLAGHICKSCITAEDAISLCGGRVPFLPKGDLTENVINDNIRSEYKVRAEKNIKPLDIVGGALLAIAFAIMAMAGIKALDDRGFYFISLLMLLVIMLPFFLGLERKRCGGVELATAACLCAVAAASRAMFFMLPEIKPMCAIVIIAGACMGCRWGFIVGAVSAFISNFALGQGPWTPWQMLAFGVIGYLSGLLFDSLCLKKSKLFFMIFGMLSCVLIYGVILNCASVLMFGAGAESGAAVFVASFMTGLPFDVAHGISTVAFLAIISEGLVKRLERIKYKYIEN